jgi:hypothetical protein
VSGCRARSHMGSGVSRLSAECLHRKKLRGSMHRRSDTYEHQCAAPKQPGNSGLLLPAAWAVVLQQRCSPPPKHPAPLLHSP